MCMYITKWLRKTEQRNLNPAYSLTRSGSSKEQSSDSHRRKVSPCLEIHHGISTFFPTADAVQTSTTTSQQSTQTEAASSAQTLAPSGSNTGWSSTFAGIVKSYQWSVGGSGTSSAGEQSLGAQVLGHKHKPLALAHTKPSVPTVSCSRLWLRATSRTQWPRWPSSAPSWWQLWCVCSS